MRKKVGFISLGCAKALSDSEQLMYFLREAGCVFVDKIEKADLVIINTCSFIEDAIAESMENIEEATEKNAKVIVMGCLVSTGAESIKRRFPSLLEVISDQDMDEVVRVLQKHLPPIAKEISLDATTRVQLTPPHYSYLKISEGCDNQCSFCKIPELKGKLKSKDPAELIRLAQMKVEQGVKELILIAQDTLVFGGDRTGGELIKLLEEMSRLDVWLRLHYIYPYKAVDRLVELMSDGKILPYLDMPLQHISSKILRNMKRPGEYQKMLDKIEHWRAICPELAIRSSFILGFPGEMDEDFDLLIDFLEDAKLDRVAFFKYSAVDGLASNDLTDRVDDDLVEERFHIAMQRQQDISAEILRSKIGQKKDIIIDSFDTKTNTAVGRTMADSPDVDGLVYVSGLTETSVGMIVKGTITDSTDYDLVATAKKVII